MNGKYNSPLLSLPLLLAISSTASCPSRSCNLHCLALLLYARRSSPGHGRGSIFCLYIWQHKAEARSALGNVLICRISPRKAKRATGKDRHTPGTSQGRMIARVLRILKGITGSADGPKRRPCIGVCVEIEQHQLNRHSHKPSRPLSMFL
jgi:hypothetical protein